ncbi:uncharacterized protein EDB91DRAFT_140289 [Suillus paluster]|uniref:uncharacterized protein n=1 Tax=Suillus paluster TaxID=48578 RepID=UPI001B871133|nr:uncharacterized protein EDB91DRAFT_140289 [Suillus paluster]KAG1724505.1 hypothetical protein EDB91DRAFT_140289 [Suillus paluster]
MPYLNSSIDPTSLGFLAILLGGSRAHCLQVQSFPEEVDRDWDGLGILQSRSNIERLVVNDKLRASLCSLLHIVNEEAPGDSWTDLVDNDVEEDAWDVIRFSGRAADGSKRTIKLWSLDHILQALNDPAPHLIKVASFRNVPCCPRFHPRLGWTALVHQPRRAAGGLSILQDRDIFLLKNPSTTTKSLRYAVLGVTCDLLLTSVLLFHTSSHRFLDPPRSRLLVKWLGQDPLLNPDALDEVIKSIYKSETYYPTLRKNLENEMSRLICLGAGVSQKSDSEADDETSIQISGTLLVLGEHNDIQGPYNRFLFEVPPTFIQSNDNTPLIPVVTNPPDLGSGEFEFTSEKKEELTISSPFSSNSQSYFTHIRTKGGTEWTNAFVKVSSAASIKWERKMLTVLSTHISPGMLQNLLAYNADLNSLVMTRIPGKTLNDFRLEYAMTRNCEDFSFKSSRDALSWFVDIEIRRAYECGSLYSVGKDLADAPEGLDSPIHKFYYDRLHNDVKFTKHYYPTTPGFSGDNAVQFDDFIALPWKIDGVEYPPLQESFRKAERILDPHGQILPKLWACLGLGDSHGGNVMISPKKQDPAIYFIDYEAAGHHSPFLDLAKPLYLDGFFSVMYHDITSKSSDPTSERAPVSWRIDDGKVCIDLDAPLSDLDKVICFMKLEYTLKPLLEYTAWNLEEQMESAGNVLSAALLCCALLTRDFSRHPDSFFLNCAVGILLYNDLKGSLKRFCGWDNWPCVMETSVNDKELTSFGGGGFSLTPEQFDTQLFSILFNKVDLEPDSVFLKRLDDTLRLHKKFSKDSNESSAVVIQRIGGARRTGIRVAPHTCIRESIFAEPRIDHHFQYQEVQETRRSRPYRMTLVDLGCCMGTDLRKLVVDGFPVLDIMGLDIENREFRVFYKFFINMTLRIL